MQGVLIAFMPFLKADNPEAARIHEEYQTTNDQKTFLAAARNLIDKSTPKQQYEASQRQVPQSAAYNNPTMQGGGASESFAPQSNGKTLRLDPSSLFNMSKAPADSMFGPSPSGSTNNHSGTPMSLLQPPQRHHTQQQTQNPASLDRLNANVQSMSLGDDPIVAMQSIWGSSPITPPRPHQNQQPPTSPWASSPAPENNDLIVAPSFLTPPRGAYNNDKNSFGSNSQSPRQNMGVNMPLPSVTIAPSAASKFRTEQPSPAVATRQAAASNILASPIPTASPVPPSSQQRKPSKPQPSRLWAHFKDQPGRLSVSGLDGHDPSLVLRFQPRQELIANWSIPLKFLQHHRQGKNLQEAIKGLAVGLFRRGCADNNTQASIISKFVTERNEYGVDPATQTIRGKLPFFSPRTPGNVVLRLYWDDDPQYTIASGPTLLVQVKEPDFESSVRFILSNFKGKKSNPTSLSSLLSLALVLETPLTVSNESAARAVWGCIQEARKVVEMCNAEYSKTSAKLQELEEAVKELKEQVEEEDGKSHMSSSAAASHDGVEDENAVQLREKTRTLMSGRASNERKWRDSQLAFASILRATVTNPSMSMLLRRDMIMKMRIEFELWCPLSEEFAVPDNKPCLWYEPIASLPNTITAEQFKGFALHRNRMQIRTLGFEPNTMPLEDVLFPRNPSSPNQRVMDSGAVVVLNNLSSAMGKSFHDLYKDEERVIRLRELVRERAESVVTKSNAFAPGTRVVIFGSSANGFGSPKSDIDMCLIMPHDHEFSKDDPMGSAAMEKLANCLTASGMEGVDASRLTARIPIIRFFCPNPLPAGDEEKLIECDLSMHNPLAVLNTSLLRTYAEITPVTRVLAAIVKRWAKERDINDPSRHTLSSYGYILMLLHFLTYHKRDGNGLLVPVAPPEGNAIYRTNPNQQGKPVLPNLQWVDPAWPRLPQGNPYRELASIPQNFISHPLETGKSVNAYFYKPNTLEDKSNLQALFPGQDLSLAILLASFFRYYAYEFDYKRHVVSLNSTATRGVVEREVKAELDGWRNFSAALTIEDPFETFYDVAHVLRGGYYHRIRREFAVAYSKIADAASGRPGSWNKPGIRGMTGEELIDWICEPIALEREREQQSE
jgi:DNA polymerase sigma